MMTLEELWESLRQNPETKATMEEVDKSYKLFKKTENLIVSDLEDKLKKMQNKQFILYSMLYETLEKQGFENVASQIDQMTGLTYDKEADWFKGNRNYDKLKQQLAEKDAEVQNWKDGTMVVKLGKLEEQLAEKDEYIKYNVPKLIEANETMSKQLAEKEKECVVWERAYEYAIFECDFYKNHTQTTNEETMKRIEQLYEKILKRAKLLMEDK